MPNNFLDLEGLKYYTTKILNNLKAQASGVLSFNGRTGNITPQTGDYTASMVGAVPTSRTVNNKALSSNISLTASDVGALPITGGTLTGNLTIKGSGNYGTQINFGDSDYVHFKEPTDDCLEIKAKMVNFLLGDTTDSKFTINGTNPFSGGGGSGNIVTGSYAGTGSGNKTLTFTTRPNIVVVIGGGSRSTNDADYSTPLVAMGSDGLTGYAYGGRNGTFCKQGTVSWSGNTITLPGFTNESPWTYQYFAI